METSVQSAASSSGRKRARDNETDAQRLKREKAAERQRRKRERDRTNAVAPSALPLSLPFHDLAPPPPQPQPQSAPPHIDYPEPHDFTPQPDLTPDELARRDRVRAAARERQRKHRALVKQRKQREMGNDLPLDDLPYRLTQDPNYQIDLHPNPHEPPFPHAPPGGQTFASTLLLSFSCAPLLKQHLLRTLHMTNDELASLEPILADAWEHWDHARRAHYAEQAAKAGLAPPFPLDLSPEAQQHAHHQYAAAAAAAAAASPSAPLPPPDAASSEFRARFHRSLVAPTPFRSFPHPDPGPSASTSSSSTATATAADTAPPPPPAAAIDPHLNGTPNGTKSASPASNDADFPDDPDFG